MRSISMGKGTGSLRHNNREFISDNVDADRVKDNVVIKKQPLQEAYDECFQQAVADYNAKQRRSDRKISDYFKHLFGKSADATKAQSTLTASDNLTKSFYEDVVQVGDRNDTGCGTPDAAIAQRALLAYVNGDKQLGIKPYAERNPNFHICNAVIHMDEATPHLHIDYIPVGHGYKRGPQVQNSYTKALEEMGYKGAGSFARWRAKERDVFRDICESYGLQPKPKEQEKSRGHSYTPDQYRQKMEEADKIKAEALAEAEKIKAQAKAEAARILAGAKAKAPVEKPVEAPTEPVRAPMPSHKQAGKQVPPTAPIEKPTAPVEKPTPKQAPTTTEDVIAKIRQQTAESVLGMFAMSEDEERYYNSLPGGH